MPRSRSRVASALFLVLLFVDVPAGAGPSEMDEEYLFDTWPGYTVLALVQDRSGYLWLGTPDGLFRFDGVRFTGFEPPTSERSLPTALELGEDGIWLGTSEGLFHYADGRFTTYPAAAESVTALAHDLQGTLWVGTQKGLSRYDGKGFAEVNGLAGDAVTALYPDSEGGLWVGTEDGLRHRGDEGVASYTTAEGLIDDRVTAVLVNRRGEVWVATPVGLSRYRDGRFTSYPTQGVLSQPRVKKLAEDSYGGLWLGTPDTVYYLVDGPAPFKKARGGPPSMDVYDLLATPDGSLWIATPSVGLVRARRGRVGNFGMAEGLPHGRTQAIQEDGAGRFWIGTLGGLTRIDPGGAIKTYTIDDGLPEPSVTAVVESRQGGLWVGTERGLARLVDDRLVEVPAAAGVESIRCLLEDRDGRLWIGARNVLGRLQDGRLDVFTEADGLAGSMTWGLFEDAQGVLWIASGKGLTHYDGSSFEIVPELAGETVLDLHGGRGGTLWAGTWHSGLVRLRGEEIFRYTTAQGLPHDAIGCVAEDAERLWLLLPSSIAYVRLQELEDLASGGLDSLHAVTYDRHDGMRTERAVAQGQPSCLRARDGKVWFTTYRGAVVVDPARKEIPGGAPTVVIEELLADQKPVELTGTPRLAAGTRFFEIRYTALDFKASGKIRFSYRLEGLDNEWIDAGTERTASYTNLSPGLYRFRVLARSRDGVWSETGDSVEFVLRPRFYQTWTFYLACAGAVVLLGWTLHSFRVRYLEEHNQELRAIWRELEVKNAELEAKNTELERFTYTVSHDLKSPLFTILGYLGMVEEDVRTGEREQLDDDIAQIKSAGAKMRQLLDELLELSRIGRVANPSQRVAMGELVGEGLEMVAALLAKHRVEVSVAPDLPVVTGDRQRLLEVVQNLLENAVKYMGEQAAPRIEIGCRPDPPDGTFLFYVRDNGMGIEPGHQEKIFDLFDKLDADSEGTGVGLALVQRILEVHGGSVWVESQGKGGGSTFYFTLPASSEQPVSG